MSAAATLPAPAEAKFLSEWPGGYDERDVPVVRLGRQGLVRTHSEVVNPHREPATGIDPVAGEAALFYIEQDAVRGGQATRVKPVESPRALGPVAVTDQFERGLRRIEDGLQMRPGEVAKEVKKPSIWASAVGFVAVAGAWAYVEMMQRTSDGQIGKVLDLLLP